MIVTDIEATGFNAKKCSILSIGAVNLNDPTQQFFEECRAFDGAEFLDGALEFLEMTQEEATDARKQSEKDMIMHFAEWVSRQNTTKIIAGEYVIVDIEYLRAACERARIKYFFPRHFVDLHSVSYADHLKNGSPIPLKDGVPNLKLDETLKYLGMPTEPRPHIAINGAKLEAEAFSRIIFKKQLLKEYKQYPLL